MKLLSVNAGSSSLKFRLYEMPAEQLIMKGTFERIGLDGSFYTTRMNREKKEVNVRAAANGCHEYRAVRCSLSIKKKLGNHEPQFRGLLFWN